ncbi:hypothetical protein AEAC466_05735 [Asticcacaulis sp. AC466]|nr:hypothetical protein AEAC466_05735 [Asticcacaulis sp. AC466]
MGIRGVFAVMAMSALAMTAASQTQSQPALQSVANVRLEWKPRDIENGHTHVDLRLVNTGQTPLEMRGWSLYLTSISGTEPSRLEDSAAITEVIGPLFRLRPQSGLPLLAPGASTTFKLDYGEAMILTDKAPTGPYIVYDDAPSKAVPVADYQVYSLNETLTPQDIYAQNEAITVVGSADFPPVFPSPLSYTYASGALSLRHGVHVEATSNLAPEAAFARHMFGTHVSPHGVPVRLSVGAVRGQTSAEAYHLDITPKGVRITGASAAGVYYGLQSLRDILSLGGDTLKAVQITDAPRFGYRGLMMDVARNFQTREKVFEVIDLMARYKLNTLHLHLTDDEGWRLEIPQLPELTSVGARRGVCEPGTCLPPAYGSGPDVNNPHGSGYFTVSDYIEILKYAHARHIEVIPEIEMPGHARAAIMAMAERSRRLRALGDPHADDYRLDDPGDASVYHSAQGFSDNVINPALPSTYRFVDAVIAELVALHRQAGVPLQTLHIGGDELADGAWEGSPLAKAAMASLPHADTGALWDHYYSQVIAKLASYGVKAAGWEELGERKARGANGGTQMAINPRFKGQVGNLFVWNNLGGSEDLAYRLANAGYDIVLSPATNLYFDMAYARDSHEYGHNWAAYTDLDAVFGFNPLHMVGTQSEGMTQLDTAGKTHLSGLEATLFSETVRDPQRIDYMLMPRLLALAERAWAPEPAWARTTDPASADILKAADWSSFANRVGKQILPSLDADMPDLAYRLPPPGLHRDGDRILVNSQLPGLTLRYTTDGHLPDATSPQVTGPIIEKGLITVAAFSRTGRSGRASSLTNP